MKSIPGVVFAFFLMVPATAQGQEWTTEQQEVWETLEACWDSEEMEMMAACYHEDYRAFVVTRNVPRNKLDALASIERSFVSLETVWDNRIPMSIDIRNGVAVVLYVSDWSQRDKIMGEADRGTTNWTEVFVKTDGRWQCITDHGTDVGGG